jgi:hypothetical protein
VTAEAAGGARCAVHPLRRAADACPVCARPRCAADAAAAPGGGCVVCQGRADGPSGSRATPLEQLVRAALAGYGAAVLGGVVAAQYVDAQLFAYLTPFVVGVLTAAAAQAAAAGPRSGRFALQVRVVAAVLAVLGVALGFALERSTDVLDGSTLLPYVAAVTGVVLWLLPPKARPAS